MKTIKNRTQIKAPGLYMLETVVLNERIQLALNSLEPFIKEEKLTAVVTSGVRTTEHQLSLILEEAERRKLGDKYDLDSIRHSMMQTVLFNGRPVFAFVPVWSELLRQGYMINPPIAARCVFAYTKADGTQIPANTMLDISTHQKGRGVDIDGDDKSADDIVVLEKFVKKLHDAGSLPMVQSWLREPKNDCLHLSLVEKFVPMSAVTVEPVAVGKNDKDVEAPAPVNPLVDQSLMQSAVDAAASLSVSTVRA